jgi:threonine dehydrogenase-like Zn-dependent dehydrogenase
MRAYQLLRGGAGIDALVKVEGPDPKPAYRQVLVKVAACSLNFRDLGIVRGTYRMPVRDNIVPLSDGAGEVVETRRFLVREADSVQVVPSSLISPRVIRASCFCCPDPLTNFVHSARLSRSRNSPTPPGSPGACPGPWCADRSETPCCRPHGQGPVAQWYRHPWCR